MSSSLNVIKPSPPDLPGVENKDPLKAILDTISQWVSKKIEYFLDHCWSEVMEAFHKEEVRSVGDFAEALRRAILTPTGSGCFFATASLVLSAGFLYELTEARKLSPTIFEKRLQQECVQLRLNTITNILRMNPIPRDQIPQLEEALNFLRVTCFQSLQNASDQSFRLGIWTLVGIALTLSGAGRAFGLGLTWSGAAVAASTVVLGGCTVGFIYLQQNASSFVRIANEKDATIKYNMALSVLKDLKRADEQERANNQAR